MRFEDFILAGVTLVAGFLLGRLSAKWDRAAAASLASKLKRIEDTRLMLLRYILAIEATAEGDAESFKALSHEQAVNPLQRPEPLLVDADLSERLTSTALEVWQRGPGNSRGNEWLDRIAKLRISVRESMDAQELRAINGKELLTISPEGAARLWAVLPAIRDAMQEPSGPPAEGVPETLDE